MTGPRARRARYRSVYVNGIPIWECGRCGDRQLAATPHAVLVEHENTCGQPDQDRSSK